MPNFSGIWSASQQFQARGQNIWPKPPGAPTIGTATAGTFNCASVTFTAPGCTGAYPTGVTGYRVVSTPGCFTQTGASSPLVVSGLTTGTSYTFKAQATNGGGYGPLSAASNSITAIVQTCATYTTAGTYSWVAPSGVTSVSVVLVSGAGGDKYNNGVNGTSGSGGNLGYKNNITVVSGNSYNLTVGAAGLPSNTNPPNCGGNSCFNYSGSGPIVYGGTNGTNTSTASANVCGGGRGGNGRLCTYGYAGGGGAGGYSGNGGNGAKCGISSTAGSGGGGGGGSWPFGYGGGVGLLGQGANGTACGGAGSGGSGKIYGGGGAGNSVGGSGAVRIVWCKGGVRGTPSFPSTNVGA